MMASDHATWLVEEWIRSWVHVRGLTSTEVDDWPCVHVGSHSRETELICVDPGPEAFTALMRHIDGDTRAMLTLFAEDIGPYRSLRLPTGVHIHRDDETLMSTRLTEIPIPRLDDEFTFRWDLSGHAMTYALESGDRVAAEGTVGIIGAGAIFDAVETTPAFQRRGLGRHVMAILTAQALGRGATHGVLAASAPGRALYQSLGWESSLEMLSLMGTVPPQQ